VLKRRLPAEALKRMPPLPDVPLLTGVNGMISRAQGRDSPQVGRAMHCTAKGHCRGVAAMNCCCQNGIATNIKYTQSLPAAQAKVGLLIKSLQHESLDVRHAALGELRSYLAANRWASRARSRFSRCHVVDWVNEQAANCVSAITAG
jgi:hypothetical protein